MKTMKRLMSSAALAACLAVGMAAPAPAADSAAPAAAPAVEKPHLIIGTAALSLTYLPLSIAYYKGYFKKHGLDVQISAFSGGSKALEAMMGGSVDIVSGAYSNTLTMAARGQKLTVFVDQIRCPGFAIMVSKRKMAEYHGLSDLKGMKIGVSAPGSSTHMVLNYLLKTAGLSGSDVSVIGVGTSAGAVAAVRQGQIDALINSDPVLTMLQESGDATDVVDMRTVETSDKVFGGPYPEGSFYAKTSFIKENPKTIQAVTDAVVDADHWLATATPEQVADTVPETYLLNNRPLYMKAFSAMRTCLSPTGLLDPKGAATVLKVLSDFSPDVKNADIKLEDTYDNSFVNAASKTEH